MGYVRYGDWYAEIVARDLASGPWQEGLVDGRYAWDESNVQDDPLVKAAWQRIDERRHGESNVLRAKRPHINARRDWTSILESRCLANGLCVQVRGPDAWIGVYGCARVAKGCEMYWPLVVEHGLDLLPVEFHWLAHVATIGEIPVFQVEMAPLFKGERTHRSPAPRYLVGRLDIPYKPRPSQRILDTAKRATNLATALDEWRKPWEALRERLRAEAQERADLAFAAELKPGDAELIEEAFA